jgi:hypothetical protein
VTQLTLTLPDALERFAREQAAAAGVSLDEFIVAVLTNQASMPEFAERYFAARALRVKPGRAREILARIGADTEPDAEDRV